MPRYATPKEILDAFETLTPTELALLWEIAAMSLPGTQFSDPTDLIHETLHQCMMGKFKWELPAAGATPSQRSDS